MIEPKQRLILRKFIIHRNTMKDFGLSSVDLGILITIFDNEDCEKVSQTKIANDLGIAQPSISKRASNLVKKGILVKGNGSVTMMGYKVPIRFYKPSKYFIAAANTWYENKNKQNKEEQAEVSAGLLKRNIGKDTQFVQEDPEAKEKLKAMSNIKIKPSLWDDEGGLNDL